MELAHVAVASPAQPPAAQTTQPQPQPTAAPGTAPHSQDTKPAASAAPSPPPPPVAAAATLWYERFFGWQIVRNDASVARDNLANERTLLAVLRTSLAFLALAVALAKLEKGALIFVSAYTLSIFAALVFLYWFARYFAIKALLQKQMFPVDSVGPLILLAGVAVLTALGIALISQSV